MMDSRNSMNIRSRTIINQHTIGADVYARRRPSARSGIVDSHLAGPLSSAIIFGKASLVAAQQDRSINNLLASALVRRDASLTMHGECTLPRCTVIWLSVRRHWRTFFDIGWDERVG